MKFKFGRRILLSLLIVLFASCGYLAYNSKLAMEQKRSLEDSNIAGVGSQSLEAQVRSGQPIKVSEEKEKLLAKQPHTHAFEIKMDVRLADLPSGRFKTELSTLSPSAQQYALRKLEQLRVPFNDIASLHVDATGHPYYECVAPLPPLQSDGESELTAAAVAPLDPATSHAPVPVGTPPIRHSKAGSTKVIYLDFNGHTISGTQWNLGKGSPGDADYRPAVASYVAKPFDSDADPLRFSDQEQATIIRIWERVAEDFLPFDVDVTTEEPASFTSTTGRILITASIDSNGVNMPSSATAAGVAYLDCFGKSDYVSKFSPALVYADNEYFYADYIAETASHEMGHNMSLSHDGTITDEYYSGHGYDSISWGPIMGTGYNRNVTQWSKGEYLNSNNSQDDLAIIEGHLGYASVIATDTNAAAIALTSSTTALSGSGVIGHTGEADRFSFVLTGTSLVSLTAYPFATASDRSGGNGDLSLQLYDSTNSLISSGDANNSYTPAATLSVGLTAGTYYLRVSGTGAGTPLTANPTGYTTYASLGRYSVLGTKTVPSPPVFSYQPTSQTVYGGQMVNFSVSASGTPNPSYQWQRLPVGGSTWANVSDTGGYTGATTYSLTLDLATTAINGDQLRCVASNIAGAVNSNAVTLTVNAAVAPSITGLSNPVSVNYGEYLSLYTSVNGTSPITFQWKKDGVNIPGATYSSFTKSNVTTVDSGSYVLTATNYAGTTTSSAVAVTVNPAVAPAISGLPATMSLEYGSQISFYPSISGTQPITFQWKKNGVNIPNATSQYFSLYPVTTADSGKYTLTATNFVGTTVSQTINVSVSAVISPLITQQPLSLEVAKSASASFSVTVTGSPSLLFQWFKNGQAIASANYSSFSISQVTAADSGAYSVRVSNDAGSVTSVVADLTVLPATLPVIGYWPAQANISPSYSYISFSPSVSGTAPLTYQWFKNGEAIAGATSAYYYNYNATESSVGIYALQVSNEAGLVTSPDAVVNWTGGATNSPWMDAVQLGDVVYFLASSPGRIMRYNLSQENWLPIIYLPETKVPTAFLPTTEGIFIAYNRDLVRRSLNSQTEVAVASSSATIQQLFGMGQLVYFQEGLTTRSRNRATLAAGPDSSPGYYESASFTRAARPAYSDSLHALYTTRLSTTPNDIEKYSVATNGVISYDSDSPYHADFRIGNRQYFSPGDALLFDNSGVIYTPSTLKYVGSLGSSFDDLAFLNDGTPIVLRGKKVSAHGGAGFVETGRYSLDNLGYSIFSKGSSVFVFGAPVSSATNPVVSKILANAFAAIPTGTVVNPVNKIFSIEDAFIDNNSVIHLLSRSQSGVVRWDTKTKTFLPAMALRGRPSFLSYAPAIDRLVLMYGDGSISDFFPGTDLKEQVFGYVPNQNRPFSLVAMDDLTFLNIGMADSSGDLRMVIGSAGEVKDLSTFSYWGAAQSWQSSSRRLYSLTQFSYNSISYVDIPGTGILPEGTGISVSDVVTPLRFSADGTLVLSGNKRILNADLQQVGTLENSVMDGVWLSDGLYTIRTRPSGTELQKWARTTYSKTGSLNLRGIPLRIFKVDDKNVAVVTLIDGYVAFHLISSELSLTSSFLNSSAPLVTEHLINQTVAKGYSALFKVAVSGASSFTYQWQKDGVNIAGATADVLQFSNVSVADAGTYTVVVTGAGGLTTSDSATLTVITKVAGSTASSDFNGDGKPDVMWQNRLTGERYIYLMNGASFLAGASLGTVSLEWTIGGTGDFNHDGQTDVLWQNENTGERYIYLMNGTTFAAGVSLGVIPREWLIVAVGDFNQDGQSDVMWENRATGQRYIYLMSGTAFTGGVDLGIISLEWTITGTGDFNGDGKTDLLLQNIATGEQKVQLMDGTTLGASISLGTYYSQQIAGVGDFNNDGKPDILLTNLVTGERTIRLMNGVTAIGTVSLGVVSFDWVLNRPMPLRAPADFNADGRSDVVWQNSVTGERYVYLMSGVYFSSGYTLVLPASIDWKIAATADFNQDGKPDLVGQNLVTGERCIWLMNAGTVSSTVSLGVIPTAWSIAVAADMNGDGKPDLVWQNTTTGDRRVDLMNGTTLNSTVTLNLPVSAQWTIAATADFDRDGKPDLIGQNLTTGERCIWIMNGLTMSNTLPLGTVATQWSIATAADLNADGFPDILWQNTVTGERYIYLMNYYTFVSAVSLGTIPTAWAICR